MKILKFLRLSADERGLLISALFHLLLVRVALWVLPFQRLIKRVPQTAAKRYDGRLRNALPPQRIAWAIHTVSCYLPGTRNCLVQSLAAQRMLACRGYSSHLHIGVAKDDSGRFWAHAWVECGGKIILGGAGSSQYTAFPPLEVQR